MLWHQRLGYTSFFNKLVSKRILCIEESVHVLFSETNSLNENDAQDEDFELGLAGKDLLLLHEKGKSSGNGSGPRAVSSEGGQGLNQSGGSTPEPSLEQNQSHFSKTGSRTGLEIGSRTGLRVDSLGDWVTAMQEELHKFERNKVCHLVSRPEDRSIIDNKWVFKNKLDKVRTICRNKAKLVVQS